MEIRYTTRSTDRKKNLTTMRREGNIPAVLYVKGKSQNITVIGDDYQAALRKMSKGSLPTTVFQLKDEEGNVTKAIVKDIQYHITSYRVVHLDFLELKEDTLISANVPIRLKNELHCSGVKLGGVLRPVIRNVKVRCLPRDLPAEFFIDVETLGMKQSRRLKDIDFPENVEPVANVEEVVVIVAKR